MKKLLFLIGLALLFQNFVFAADTNIQTFSNDEGLFGLKNKTTGAVIVEPMYRKLIPIGDYSWIAAKKTRYGLIDNTGFELVPMKYRHADRVLGKYAKLGNDNDYGLYDEKGNVILPQMYSSIELLYGNMLLTCKKYKYGVTDLNGNILLPNEFDDIYMPDKESLRILYKGEWYEFEKASPDNIVPPNSKHIKIADTDVTFTKLVTDTGIASGYYTLTTADYILKIISSISPAYEQTIDDLMLSHGADTVNIVMKMTWLPQFPFVYVKKYINNLMAPNNGPLSPIRQNMQRKLAN